MIPCDIHFQITCLTLGYLSLPPNDCEADENQMRQSTLNGFFGYLEYAAVCWVLHVQEVLISSLEDKQLAEFGEALDVFLEAHYRDPQTKPGIPKATSDELQMMKSFDFYDKFSQAVVWSRKQLRTHGQASTDDGILDLLALVCRFREVLESLSTSQLSDDERLALQLHYGTRWYKCRYLGCFYFHHGFKTKAQRDQHCNRHEKPFVCIVTECDFSSLGFESKDALTDHLLEAHEIDMDGKLNFPPPPRKMQKIIPGSHKHQCPKCQKSFTRGHNLKAHFRSRTNEKPFSCSVCGMGFGRQYDMKRHESLHTGDKSFKCFGTLKSGATWGCSLAFGRADKLADHFKSKTGQQCLQSLLIEERQEAQDNNSQVATEAAVATRVGIDQSLLGGFLFQAHAHNSYQHQPSLPKDFFK